MNLESTDTRMDAKEVKSAVASLEKSTDDGLIIKLLNVLNDGVEPTEKLLRETKVGVAVNKLRSNNNPQINSLVKKMIKNWRESVQNEKSSKKTNQVAERSNNNSPAMQVEEKQENKIPKGPRNPKTDNVDIDFYDNPTRNASVSALYTALATDRGDDSQHILSIATNIESEVYRAEYLAVNDTYRNKLRSLTMNLRNKKNPELRDRLLTGGIRPEVFITMSPSEMAPESLKKELEKMHKQNLFEAQGATEKRAVTDRFTCGKCKHKRVSYYQMQTRSADEPLTTFCTCENCGNRWKFS